LNPLFEIISREIAKSGVIPFARFMELALYCPVCGFYEKETDNVGRNGDFFTNVSTGNFFGELLAFQFSDWLDELRTRDGRLQIVEAGAHDGQLAKDILTWLRARREPLARQLFYCIVEPSPRRRARQQATLREFENSTGWVENLSELKTRAVDGVRGIIFSNELLDAMPVRRIGWDAVRKSWFEWGVGLDDGKFAWKRIQNPDPAIRHPALPEDVLALLPGNFTTELCPAAESWWRAAAGILKRGRLMTIDYGLSGDEFFRPERREGTLRGYFRHHLAADVLANVGEQDLTAHVNFTAIQEAGESPGLQTDALVSQEKFLVQIAGRIAARPAEFGEWNPERTRQFQTLTHPEHLGRSFRVLIQSRRENS
jgi:SAM-dependent MidA family methyltransferase